MTGNAFFRLLSGRIKRTEHFAWLQKMDVLVSGCADVDAAGGRSGPAPEESKVS
jgi:hypothetical protein